MTTPARSDYRFLDALRVRWAEVDMQKIVFNGHYLMYFDTAVAGYWRALALPYHATMESLQGDLYVRKATLEYEGSARYDDRCAVGVRCARIGTTSMVFSAAVFRGEQRLVHGELVYVFADPVTQTSRPVPQALRQVLTAFEDGESMLDVQLGSWLDLGQLAAGIRREVLIQEHEQGQGTAATLDGDADDQGALHALVLNRFGVPVAAARLLAHGDGAGSIGRVAVVQALRGSGVGRAMVQTLLAAARAQGLQQLRVQAQLGSAGFFQRLGFSTDGAPGLHAGAQHQTMTMALGG
jgi:YbgC/YbaW family acyl-CoA thioester hydrolase